MVSAQASDAVPTRIDPAITRELVDEALWIVVSSEQPMTGSDVLKAVQGNALDVRGSSLISTLAAVQKHADPDSYFAHLIFSKKGNGWVVWASEQARDSYQASQARKLIGQDEAEVAPSLPQQVAEVINSFRSVPMWPEERLAVLRDLADEAQKEGDLGLASRLLYGTIPPIESFRFIKLLDDAGGVSIAQSYQGDLWVAAPLGQVAGTALQEEALLEGLREAARLTAEVAAREAVATHRQRYEAGARRRPVKKPGKRTPDA